MGDLFYPEMTVFVARLAFAPWITTGSRVRRF